MEDDIIAVGLGNQQRVAGPLARTEKIPKMEGIVIDTNVFVAAGFNPRSASARVPSSRPGRTLSPDLEPVDPTRDRNDATPNSTPRLGGSR